MAWKKSSSNVLCLLAISACLSVVHGYLGTADTSGQSANFSVGSGFIRNQGPESNVNSPLTERRVSSSLVSNSGFAGSISGPNLSVSAGSLNVPTDAVLRPIVNAASADRQEQRIVNIPGSFGTGVGTSTVVESALAEDFLQEPVTITQETTVDVFKTVSNIIYNSVPITLTEFIKTTEVAPTLQVISTPVDDRVFVATAPVTVTQTVTVTNTNTGYLYATEVSTDVYTVTHKAYEIRQKLITSTLQQTQVFRPTIVRTRINTEYDTQTVEQTIFNTIVIQPRSTVPVSLTTRTFTQTFFGDQLFAGQGSGQQDLVVGQSQASGSGSRFQQTSGQVSSSDQQSQQLLNFQLPEQDVRQFPVLGRISGDLVTGQGQQFAGRGRQELFVRPSQASGSGSQFQQTSGQVSSSDHLSQQLLNFQLPEQDIGQFPVLGRIRGDLVTGQGQQFAGQGQQFAGQGQQFAGQGQRDFFVRQSQASGSGSLFQQTSGQVSSSDQRNQQRLNLQLPEQDVRQFPVLGR